MKLRMMTLMQGRQIGRRPFLSIIIPLVTSSLSYGITCLQKSQFIGVGHV